MNNIEKLAIEHASHTGFCEGDLEQVTFTIKQLEAFAKALQQSSEPVAKYKASVGGFSPPKWVTHQEKHSGNLGEGYLPLFTLPPVSVPVEDAKVQDLILELKCLGEVLAMEMTTIEGNPIAPIVDDAWQTIERLVATQSASVPLEKYNKLLDALKAIEFATKPEPDDGSFHENAYTLASQAIAEAELSEGKEG